MKSKKVISQFLSVALLSTLSLYSHTSATDTCENVSSVKENVPTSTCFQ
jgi:hypothetical protein